MKKNPKGKKAEKLAEQWRAPDYIHSDVLGSYTGTSEDEDMYPEQDADDL